jgi:hypothetical protein
MVPDEVVVDGGPIGEIDGRRHQEDRHIPLSGVANEFSQISPITLQPSLEPRTPSIDGMQALGQGRSGSGREAVEQANQRRVEGSFPDPAPQPGVLAAAVQELIMRAEHHESVEFSDLHGVGGRATHPGGRRGHFGEIDDLDGTAPRRVPQQKLQLGCKTTSGSGVP